MKKAFFLLGLAFLCIATLQAEGSDYLVLENNEDWAIMEVYGFNLYGEQIFHSEGPYFSNKVYIALDSELHREIVGLYVLSEQGIVYAVDDYYPSGEVLVIPRGSDWNRFYTITVEYFYQNILSFEEDPEEYHGPDYDYYDDEELSTLDDEYPSYEVSDFFLEVLTDSGIFPGNFLQADRDSSGWIPVSTEEYGRELSISWDEQYPFIYCDYLLYNWRIYGILPESQSGVTLCLDLVHPEWGYMQRELSMVQADEDVFVFVFEDEGPRFFQLQ